MMQTQHQLQPQLTPHMIAATMRADDWLWDAATPEQLDKAIAGAIWTVESEEDGLPALLEWHNTQQRIPNGLPLASLGEFRVLCIRFLIHVELLDAVTAGAMQ
jgi:hypothetical protein